MCRLVDESDVDDVVQEVFVAAFAGLAEFRHEARPKTWLYRIAVNKAWNFWDRQRRRLRREARRLGARVVERNTPEDEVFAVELMNRMERLVSQLPRNYADAFIHCDVEGRTLGEASRLLRVPVSTLSFRTRRVRDLLLRRARQTQW